MTAFSMLQTYMFIKKNGPVYGREISIYAAKKACLPDPYGIDASIISCEIAGYLSGLSKSGKIKKIGIRRKSVLHKNDSSQPRWVAIKNPVKF